MRSFDVLAVGASTGGPAALPVLLAPLAGKLTVPIVITQHIGLGFAASLAQSLTQQCNIAAHEAQDGAILQPGEVYLGPGGRHFTIRAERGALVARLDDGPPQCFCKPSVDVMLGSLADMPALRTLVVILTGMGQVGMAGSRRIKDQGGCILAQDQETSVVWGMPGAVAGAGLCDAVAPLPSLASAVLRKLGSPA